MNQFILTMKGFKTLITDKNFQNLLIKIGYIVKKELIVNISRESFIRNLSNNIDNKGKRHTVFQRSINTFKGTVSNNSFELWENHHLFDTSHNDASLIGSIKELDGKTVLGLEANGFSQTNIVLISAGVFSLLLSPFAYVFQDDKLGVILTTVIMPLLFIFFSVHSGRSSSRKILHDFERELYYLIGKEKQNSEF